MLSRNLRSAFVLAVALDMLANVVLFALVAALEIHSLLSGLLVACNCARLGCHILLVQRNRHVPNMYAVVAVSAIIALAVLVAAMTAHPIAPYLSAYCFVTILINVSELGIYHEAISSHGKAYWLSDNDGAGAYTAIPNEHTSINGMNDSQANGISARKRRASDSPFSGRRQRNSQGLPEEDVAQRNAYMDFMNIPLSIPYTRSISFSAVNELKLAHDITSVNDYRNYNHLSVDTASQQQSSHHDRYLSVSDSRHDVNDSLEDALRHHSTPSNHLNFLRWAVSKRRELNYNEFDNVSPRSFTQKDDKDTVRNHSSKFGKNEPSHRHHRSLSGVTTSTINTDRSFSNDSDDETSPNDKSIGSQQSLSTFLSLRPSVTTPSSYNSQLAPQPARLIDKHILYNPRNSSPTRPSIPTPPLTQTDRKVQLTTEHQEKSNRNAYPSPSFTSTDSTKLLAGNEKEDDNMDTLPFSLPSAVAKTIHTLLYKRSTEALNLLMQNCLAESRNMLLREQLTMLSSEEQELVMTPRYAMHLAEIELHQILLPSLPSSLSNVDTSVNRILGLFHQSESLALSLLQDDAYSHEVLTRLNEHAGRLANVLDEDPRYELELRYDTELVFAETNLSLGLLYLAIGYNVKATHHVNTSIRTYQRLIGVHDTAILKIIDSSYELTKRLLTTLKPILPFKLKLPRARSTSLSSLDTLQSTVGMAMPANTNEIYPLFLWRSRIIYLLKVTEERLEELHVNDDHLHTLDTMTLLLTEANASESI